MQENKTFDLEDLTEECWEKVIFFQIYHSSGLGGPGVLCLVTKDKKKYYLGFEDLPFNEYFLDKNLHPMFKKSSEWVGKRCPYLIESNGWVFLKYTDHVLFREALIREDMYESFRKVALNKDLVMKKIKYGYWNLPDIVGLALGAESLERLNYIRSVKAWEKYDKLIETAHEEYERKKLLPEHIVWKPMRMNNMADNPVIGEYALIVNRKGDGRLSARRFTILYQCHMSKPLLIDPSRGVEFYVLFEKDYYELYGALDYTNPKETRNNRGAAYFEWESLSSGEMLDHGRFIRCFRTVEEAKEYALCYENANGGNCFTLVTELDPIEDHKKRVKRYEAYQMFRKHYKEIADIMANNDVYPDNSSGGGAYLIDALLKGVPEISKEQLMYFRHDLPWTLEKRTQGMIEEEKQRSLAVIKKLEGECCEN